MFCFFQCVFKDLHVFSSVVRRKQGPNGWFYKTCSVNDREKKEIYRKHTALNVRKLSECTSTDSLSAVKELGEKPHTLTNLHYKFVQHLLSQFRFRDSSVALWYKHICSGIPVLCSWCSPWAFRPNHRLWLYLTTYAIISHLHNLRTFLSFFEKTPC